MTYPIKVIATTNICTLTHAHSTVASEMVATDRVIALTCNLQLATCQHQWFFNAIQSEKQ